MNFNELGNGVGLIYSTDIEGNFINTGSTNTKTNASAIKLDALSRGGEGFSLSAKGEIIFDVIGVDDLISSLLIDTVEQIDTSSPVSISTGLEEAAAQDLATAINNYIPVSGANYNAFTVGKKVVLQASTSFGDTLNGDVVNITVASPLLQTITEVDVFGGSEGGGLVSEINGALYFLNASDTAVVGDLSGSTEITEYLIMRGNQVSPFTHKQTIASTSISDLKRFDRLSVLELGASGNTDLDTIEGVFAENDMLILLNTSPYTITINDLSINSGNLKISQSSFQMINDDYVMWLIYVEDSTDGLVWKEINRVPKTVEAGSITDIELADLSVDTASVQDLAITTAKIALNAITQAQIAGLSIGTAEIIDLSITQAKLGLTSVGLAQLIALSVDSTILAANSVTTVKILDSNVTLEKLEDGLKKGFFTFPISFETDELGIVKAKIPFALEVTELLFSVGKDIEGTEDATFIPKNHAGTAMSSGQIDPTGGAVIGNDFSSTPTGNNIFSEGEAMRFETIKPTPGGKGVVTVCYTRL